MISRLCNLRWCSSHHMDLKAVLLTEGVIVATFLSTFVAARQLAPEQSASSPSTSTSSSLLCSRALATTLWGAAFASFSLMADAWPAYKVNLLRGQNSLFVFIKFLFVAPVLPFMFIGLIIDKMYTTLRFRQILGNLTNPERGSDITSMSNRLMRVTDDILVMLFGINQPRGFLKSTRLVANAVIVLAMSDSTKVPTRIFLDFDVVKEDDVVDALILGNKLTENSCFVVLNKAGKLALLGSSILPNYKQLGFLDGRSGIATIIIGVQAIGYITSIAYRAFIHLPVSPIEAIGFFLSMLVIVRSVVHSVGVVRARPLVIFLNPTQEQEMLEKCESIGWSNADEKYCSNAMTMGMVMVATVLMALTILVEWPVLKIGWLDAIGPILFLLSLITQFFSTVLGIRGEENLTFWIPLILGCIMSFGGIVVSIVATILNWQTDKFDRRTPSVIHKLPFIG